MNGTPTTTVYAQDEDGDTFRVEDATDTLDEFAEEVEEGDYIAVVYRTPSNGGSLQRVMGTVSTVARVPERFDDLRFQVEEATGDAQEDTEAYLHVNPETGDYHFRDGRAPGDVPEDGFGVEKWAWTPEDE